MLNKFSSNEELKNYVEASPQGSYYILGGMETFGRPSMADGHVVSVSPVEPEPAPEPSAEASDSRYSTTNIQVKDGDEADILKTDGEYIYMISNNTISFLRHVQLRSRNSLKN